MRQSCDDHNTHPANQLELVRCLAYQLREFGLDTVLERLKQTLGLGQPGDGGVHLADNETQSYWSAHNVTLHHAFDSADGSLDYFHWRNDQYFNYIELMPVSGRNGEAVLDYGCGPGHDLVGFGVYSRPKRLIGMDISPTSLGEAQARLGLHGIQAELLRLEPTTNRLQLDCESIDYVHSSGVLHHTPDPVAILREFHRILVPGGRARIMVYNRESLWLHLYVAYQKQVLEGAYAGLSLLDAFSKTTDGEDCPISRAYAPTEFVGLCRQAGFIADYLGAAISMHEAGLFQRLRYDAVQSRALPSESRRFLLELKLGSHGFPMYRETYAGVDACYRLTKAR